jgi:2'-5' RNA ligase
MKKFSDVLKNKNEIKPFTYEYGCVMLYFDIPNWEKDILSLIKKDDIYDVDSYGIENETHITLLYGFEQSVTADDIKKILKDIPKIEIELKFIDIFENNEYDVVKFDINCFYLNELNGKLQALPSIKTFDVYHPHMTIAYLKHGKGKKYIGEILNPIKVKSSKIIYSLRTGTSEKKVVEIKKW